VQYAQQARSAVSAAVRARFDVAGFDPRGVAGSQPAVHCMTGPQLDRYFETSDMPQTAAQMTAIVTENRLFAAQCARNAGPLLPYIGTRSVARDLDVLRAALGDAGLTYLGKSYGTYLGAWYAQLFPHRVRALVLDGALNPDASSLGIDIAQAQGFEVALRSFTASCLRQSRCPLGLSAGHSAGQWGAAGAGIARLQGLLNRAARTPLANDLGDGRPANGALLLQGIVASLYSKAYWPTLRTGLQDAFGGNGTVLVQLGDLLVERNSSGGYTNLADSNMAINCLDRPWPRGLSSWRAAASAAAKAAPQFGQVVVWSSLACAYWPVKSYPLPRITAVGSPSILVVGTTRDPATPYQWARALARELKRGVLLGWNGDGHTAYMMGSSCVDNAVDSYLISVATPKTGTVCS
jgi:pimeloyl-ACP methyl ester carboxylesterase